MRFYAVDDDKNRRVSVAEWRSSRSDTIDIAAVDWDADGFISFAEFSAWTGAKSTTTSEPAAEAPSAAPAGNDGAPDIPEAPEPTRRKPAVAGADDEEGPTPITRRRAAASAPDEPAAPMKRPAPPPVRPPL